MIDIDEVVQVADLAYRGGASNAPATRKAWLRAIAAALESHRPDLVALAAEETHLGTERLEGELTRTIFQLRFLGDEAIRGAHLGATIDHADRTWGMGPRPDLRSVARPIGVVAVFGASNFPFAFSVAGGDSASALAAGCPVVHKAHPAHPVLARHTAGIVVEALRTAGAPDGWFALVEGQEAGVQLVQHPLVRAVAFTGSTTAGRALFDLASGRKEPIPFFGELGSTNPVFVTPAAWQKRSASITDGYLASVKLGRGQFCTKPGFLAVPAGAGGVIAAAARGDDDAALLLTPGLRDGFESSMEAFALLPGVQILHGGASADAAAPLTLLRTSAETVIARPEMLEQEMFGPASVIIEYQDAAQLEQIAPLIGGQLTSTIHAEPDDEIAALLTVLADHSGRIVWNDWPTGVSVTFAQNHGGPYPAATTSTTSVGASAIDRFQRHVTYQGIPQQLLPPEIRDGNPRRVPQRVDGELMIPEEETGR